MNNNMENNAALICTLTEAEYKQRRRLARRELIPYIRNPVLRNLVLNFEFSNDNVMRERVEEFVDLERQCCGFLNFTISTSAEVLQLTIAGLEGSESTLVHIFELANGGGG